MPAEQHSLILENRRYTVRAKYSENFYFATNHSMMMTVKGNNFRNHQFFFFCVCVL